MEIGMLEWNCPEYVIRERSHPFNKNNYNSIIDAYFQDFTITNNITMSFGEYRYTYSINSQR